MQLRKRLFALAALCPMVRNLLFAKVQLPVRPDSVATFTTPLWIQEAHRANGPVAGIAGLRFSSGCKLLRWRRNPKVSSEYLVEVPPGVDTVHAVFEAIVTWKVTRHIVMLCWEHVLLHPAHRDIQKLRIQAAVTVPRGWGVGTALQNLGRPSVTYTADGQRETLLYPPTTVERLADSPVLVGQHFGEYFVTADLRHILCVAADTVENVAVTQETLSKLAQLVEQTGVVFGARHYKTFRFLIALTDYWPNPGGIEHHDSFDVSLPRRALVDAESLDQNGSVIAHEFVHSWNGKYRRPAGHVPHDFATPLDGRLLWVYEGLTQYYEGVLAVRSGIMSPTTYRKTLAEAAAWLEGQSGRLWRSTEDTGTGISLNRVPIWVNWARISDYYYEGIFVWLDVDTLIRSKTSGRRSLDDFAVKFFGQGSPTGPKVVPYTLDDIVSTLNEVVAHGWQAFLETKVCDVSPSVNLDGIERAGYRLVYMGEPGIGQETESGAKDAIWNSIGVKVRESGYVEDVRRGGPADVAKLAPRQTIAKVGECSFNLTALAAEIKSKTRDLKNPTHLVLSQEGEEWTATLNYHGGLRYPRLERQEDETDMLSEILDRRTPIYPTQEM
ncbi:peptidase m61 domain-containing protein [Thozetella sp. PMI_491]|nr:peptidase m61 domain-containing protein [Thozetella sp. PMI_491]